MRARSAGWPNVLLGHRDADLKAITELQKEVQRAMNTRWDEMKAMRHMDDDTFVTEKEICRAINLVEDEQAKQHAQQTVQHKKAQARYYEEQLSEAREQANTGRLATARSGSRTALTRRQRQTMTDARHQECTEKCEQTLSLRACETCAITALAICSACMGRGPHEKWCRTCTKHGLSMCTRCRVDIRRACNRCRQTKWNMTRNTVADTQDAQGTGEKESIERQYTLRHDIDSTQHYADELDAPQTKTDQPIPSTPQVIQPHHHPGTAQLNHNLSHLIPSQPTPNPTQHTPTTTQLTPSHPNTNQGGMINTNTMTDRNHHATQHMETTETRPTRHNITHESMSIERLEQAHKKATSGMVPGHCQCIFPISQYKVLTIRFTIHSVLYSHVLRMNDPIRCMLALPHATYYGVHH